MLQHSIHQDRGGAVVMQIVCLVRGACREQLAIRTGRMRNKPFTYNFPLFGY
jgi:hypothetical protein